ncbi:MAG: tRNA guanosine(15) transglycosylase TgtA [Candidatus Bathyarchaeia archaeon]
MADPNGPQPDPFEQSPERDLMGRIGRLRTKRGILETPYMFPVVNPLVQPIPPRELKERFGFKAIMVNAHLLKKNFGNEVVEKGVHRFLGFDGIIATDSGAYQILVYGSIDSAPDEIIRFQESIGSDIGVILDIPTPYGAKREEAERGVLETHRRAEEAFRIISGDGMLWVGPIQGGTHFDLLSSSAMRISSLPFHILALGSPTQILKQYRYDLLSRMIATVRSIIPPSKPLHLFGAGHPAMFSLAVALGCDLFDSASYALFAREGRYMTEGGTMRLKDLRHFPCSCSVCSKYEPSEVLKCDGRFIERFLAEHNLNACMEELRRIKQAISDGALWELLGQRARSHPSLFRAFMGLRSYSDLLEKYSPSTKRGGIFYFDRFDLVRPEIQRYWRRLLERYSIPEEVEELVVYSGSDPAKRLGDEEIRKIRFFKLVNPYGFVPWELLETFPLFQTEGPGPADEIPEEALSAFKELLKRNKRVRISSLRLSERALQGLRSICEELGLSLEINVDLERFGSADGRATKYI